MLPFVLILLACNFVFLSCILYRCRPLYCQKVSPKISEWFPIRDFRPREGSEIFVFDKINNTALYCKYVGDEKSWAATKDKEERFTHFTYLSLPQGTAQTVS